MVLFGYKSDFKWGAGVHYLAGQVQHLIIRVRGFPERDILSLRMLVLGSGTDEVPSFAGGPCPCVNPLKAERS